VHVVDELRSVLRDPDPVAVTPRDEPMPVLPEWIARRVRPQPLAGDREAAVAAAAEPPGPPPSGGNRGFLRRLLGGRG
jgi:hypothetical protein